ncbi:MAG: substrate-binding domain-containing protein [Nitrospirae bacterium]|nr:substrate-binding domain-containing protein [Nitrospirota bacterium]
MKRNVMVAGMVIGFLLSLGFSAYAEEIRVGGGGAACNTVFRPVKPYFEKATGLTLTVMQSSPKNGLIDMINGRLDAAVAAVSLESMIKGADADGVKVDPAAVQKTEVAKNRTVVFLHRDNPVRKLSKDQLKAIFTGKVQNWKEVGGKDLPVIVVWGKASPGQNAQFTKEILDGETVTKDKLDSTDYAGIKQDVSANAEAIGIDPIGLADDKVSIPETPDVSSPVLMVTKGKPSPNVQKLIDFVKGEGRQYIK